jgi:hypothetical protein
METVPIIWFMLAALMISPLLIDLMLCVWIQFSPTKVDAIAILWAVTMFGFFIGLGIASI